MIKSELVQRMAARNPHLYQRDIENIIDAILGEITNALARGERVELRGFGAFSTKQRQARTGRNPRTGDKVPVTEKLAPVLQDRQRNARASQSLARGDLKSLQQPLSLELARAGQVGRMRLICFAS